MVDLLGLLRFRQVIPGDSTLHFSKFLEFRFRNFFLFRQLLRREKPVGEIVKYKLLFFYYSD